MFQVFLTVFSECYKCPVTVCLILLQTILYLKLTTTENNSNNVSDRALCIYKYSFSVVEKDDDIVRSISAPFLHVSFGHYLFSIVSLWSIRFVEYDKKHSMNSSNTEEENILYEYVSQGPWYYARYSIALGVMIYFVYRWMTQLLIRNIIYYEHARHRNQINATVSSLSSIEQIPTSSDNNGYGNASGAPNSPIISAVDTHQSAANLELIGLLSKQRVCYGYSSVLLAWVSFITTKIVTMPDLPRTTSGRRIELAYEIFGVFPVPYIVLPMILYVFCNYIMLYNAPDTISQPSLTEPGQLVAVPTTSATSVRVAHLMSINVYNVSGMVCGVWLAAGVLEVMPTLYWTSCCIIAVVWCIAWSWYMEHSVVMEAGQERDSNEEEEEEVWGVTTDPSFDRLPTISSSSSSSNDITSGGGSLMVEDTAPATEEDVGEEEDEETGLLHATSSTSISNTTEHSSSYFSVLSGTISSYIFPDYHSTGATGATVAGGDGLRLRRVNSGGVGGISSSPTNEQSSRNHSARVQRHQHRQIDGSHFSSRYRAILITDRSGAPDSRLYTPVPLRSSQLSHSGYNIGDSMDSSSSSVEMTPLNGGSREQFTPMTGSVGHLGEEEEEDDESALLP